MPRVLLPLHEGCAPQQLSYLPTSRHSCVPLVRRQAHATVQPSATLSRLYTSTPTIILLLNFLLQEWWSPKSPPSIPPPQIHLAHAPQSYPSGFSPSRGSTLCSSALPHMTLHPAPLSQIHLAQATVVEALAFSARLRLPTTVDAATRRSFVEEASEMSTICGCLSCSRAGSKFLCLVTGLVGDVGRLARHA